MAEGEPAPKKKAPKAKAKERRRKVDTAVSLYPLTLEEAVQKILNIPAAARQPKSPPAEKSRK
jgi:hypothetical protein